jgi:type II secretory pathway pseudopilin PulG
VPTDDALYARIKDANMNKPSTHPHRRSQRAFTLVELCLGLMITGLIASATAAMMVTVSRYWDQGTQLDKNAAAMSQLAGRLQQVFQDAKCIGQWQAGTSSVQPAAIAIWLRDDNSDGVMQQSELTVIRFNPGMHRIELYGAYPAAATTSSGGLGNLGSLGGSGVSSGSITGGGTGVITGGTTVVGSSSASDTQWSLLDLRAATAINNIMASQSARTLLNHVSAATLDVEHVDETSVTPMITWTVQLEDDGDGFRQPIVVSLRAPMTPG